MGSIWRTEIYGPEHGPRSLWDHVGGQFSQYSRQQKAQWKLIYQAQFIYFWGQLNFLWDSYRFLRYGASIYVPPPNGAIFE